MPKLWWALSYSSGPLLASSLVVHSLPWGKDTRPEALLMTYEACMGLYCVCTACRVKSSTEAAGCMRKKHMRVIIVLMLERV